MTDPSATGSIDIAAPPERVYGIITDLETFGQVTAESGSMRWRRGTAAAPGAVFSARNDNGKRHWSTTCTVTDAEAGRRFAFEVRSVARIPVARWQYDIEATPSGCKVTESTWDKRPGWFRKPAEIVTASPDRAGINTRNIAATLERLKARAEG
jgi:hypothetical protein